MEDLRRPKSFLVKVRYLFASRFWLVVTPGKVGTLSLTRSLRRAGFYTIHPHSLKWTLQGVYFIWIRHGIWQMFFGLIRSLRKRTLFWLFRGIRNKSFYITAVREPFGRAVSAYWEQCHYLGIDRDKLSLREHQKLFWTHCNLFEYMNWYKDELEPVFKESIFRNWNAKTGIKKIESGGNILYICRIDKMNNLLGLVSEDVGVEIRLERENIVVDERYEEFKKMIKFSQSQWEAFLQFEWATLVFSQDELLNLKVKWIQD